MITPILSQQLFVEPEVGFYKPSDEAYGFNYSLRFGGNIGITAQNDIQLYTGYKLWSAKTSETIFGFGSINAKTKFNTLVFGARKYFPHQNKIGFRVGAEYIMSNIYEEDDFADYNSLWELVLEGKGSGFSIEGGLVYNVDETTKVFVGVNYLKNDITIDKITIDGVSFTRQELGMSEDEATINMDGLNFKVSASFSLGGKL